MNKATTAIDRAERLRVNSRNYRERHRERERERVRAKARRRKAVWNAEAKTVNATDQGRARNAIRAAVRSGKIVKPAHCEDCGKQTLLHGHHADYSKPLAVEWLCSTCHGKRHRVAALPHRNSGEK